jgi:uncharacterized protein
MVSQLISADSHIDLPWLPPKLFVENCRAEFRDKVPYVEETPEGPYWTIKGGWDFATPTRILSVNGAGAIGVPYRKGVSPRFDKFEAAGLFADGKNGVRRLTDTALRVADQDHDGVRAEVLHGLTGIESWCPDIDTVAEIYRVYNEWLGSFCGERPDRFVGLACLSTRSPEAAVIEAKRARKNGLKGMLLYTIPGQYERAKPFWHDSWDPIWAIADELDIPVHIHTTGGQSKLPPRSEGEHHFMRARAVAWSTFQIATTEQLAALMFSGICERFPRIRFCLGEFGVGWIPYMLERMDEVWETRNLRHDCGLSKKPSEYWRQNFKGIVISEPLVGSLVDVLGVDTLMFGNDYAHGDSIWPDSRQVFAETFGALPQETQERIAWKNAAKLYSI